MATQYDGHITPPGEDAEKASVHALESSKVPYSGGPTAQQETAYDPNDPMNWSSLQKHSILACISLLGGLGTYAGLFIVPAYGLMSKQWHKTITEVSYQVGIYVLVLGAGPLLWNPFAQTHGRRPVVSCLT